MIIIFLICLSALLKFSASKNVLPAEIISKILDESKYDKLVSPKPLENNTFILVTQQILFRYINFFDDINQELSVQITLRLYWYDSRHEFESLFGPTNYVPLYVTIADGSRIWYPDIFIENEKNGFVHELLQPNVLIRMYKNGTTLLSIRVSFTMFCPLRLQWYPFDRHRCKIQFGSYSKNSQELQLEWEPYNPVTLIERIQLTKFTLEGYEILDFPAKPGFSIGTFDHTIIELVFKRQVSYYFVQVFTPTIMLVIISWISFWFDVTAMESRVSLGITTILSMATNSFSFNQSSPGVSYVKAVDIFTGISQTYVAAALFEFALVDWTLRSHGPKKIQNRPKTNREVWRMDEDEIKELTIKRKKAQRIDKISRWMFPLTYIGFCTVYFTICLNESNRKS